MMKLLSHRFWGRTTARGGASFCGLAILLLLASAYASSQGTNDSLAFAVGLVRAGQFDKAIAVSKSALRVHPSDPRLFTIEGIAYSMKGDNVDALRVLRRALKASPGFPAALKAEAQILSREHSPDAEPVLRQILRVNPGDSTARELLAVAQARGGSCPDAVGNFDTVGSALDSHPESLLQYGGCLFTLNKFNAAVPVFTHLVTVLPASKDARYDLALAQVRSDQNKEATATLGPLLDAHPDLDTLTLASDAFEAVGNTPRAVALLRQAIVLDPTRADTYVRFAELCILHDSSQAGIDMVTAGIARLPNDPALFLARGMLYGNMAKYQKAEADFRSAQLLDPQHGTGSYGVGLIQIQGGQYAQALTTIRAGLRAHPDNAQLHFLLARILMEDGASPGSPVFTEATDSAVEAVHLEPGLSSARDLLAEIYLRSGRPALSVEQSRAALDINPSDQTAIYHMMLASRRDKDAATLREFSKRLDALLQQARSDQTNRLRYRNVEGSSAAPAAPPQP
jgi:tetratricopeptide (TPR) repeat protein